MAKLILKTRQVGPWGMNTYALIDPDSQQSVLIDPGADPDILQEMLAGSTPVAIWLTHTHGDHIGALDEMQERLNVPVIGHENVTAVSLDQTLRNHDTIQLGEHTLQIFHTPGHIDDQICFAIFHPNDSRVIVGDTIFEGGPGRTWSTDGFQQTLQTLRQVVLTWPNDTYCYPGHGPSFRLGDIRPQIENFLAKNHTDFYGDATWDM